jgi:hypothetical protein
MMIVIPGWQEKPEDDKRSIGILPTEMIHKVRKYPISIILFFQLILSASLSLSLYLTGTIISIL